MTTDPDLTTDPNIRYLLVIFQGGASDKAYKDPGDLAVCGPYASLEEAQAWSLLGCDGFDTESISLPDVSRVVEVGATTPEYGDPEILHWEQFLESDEYMSDDDRQALDLVYPEWRADIETQRVEQATRWAEHGAAEIVAVEALTLPLRTEFAEFAWSPKPVGVDYGGGGSAGWEATTPAGQVIHVAKGLTTDDTRQICLNWTPGLHRYWEAAKDYVSLDDATALLRDPQTSRDTAIARLRAQFDENGRRVDRDQAFSSRRR